MKIEQQLINNGYKRWQNPDEFTLEKCDKFYQKAVYKEDIWEGKLYFINVYLTDWSNKPYSDQVPDNLKKDLTATFEAQFELNLDEAFDVSYSTKDVKKAEDFLQKIHTSMGCLPYDG